MTTSKTATRGTVAKFAAVLAVAATAIAGLAAPSQAAVVATPVVTPSAITGPAAGTNVLVLNLASTAATKFSSGNVGVQFQNSTSALIAKATCTTNPSTNSNDVTVATLRYLSTTKVSVTVPDLSSAPTGYWQICVYNTAQSSGTIASTATVLGRGTYTVAAAPTVTTVNGYDGTTGGQTVVSGPALGGQLLTFVGTNFPTAISASTPLSVTVGGVAATSVTAISATSFTAVAAAKAAGTGNKITITTLGGSVTWGGNYTYQNGIVVSPNTVVGGSTTDLDIQGVGFSSLTFDATNTALTGTMQYDAKAHVFLVPGDAPYDPTSWALGTASKTKSQVNDCYNVAVISDTELICTLNTAKKLTLGAGAYTVTNSNTADGAYMITIVSTAGVVPATPVYQTVVSSGGAFTIANF